MRTIQDWVVNQYNLHNYLDKASEEFGRPDMRASSTLSIGYSDAVEEFLVFENKPYFFYYSTGLEYFIKCNPLNLDKEIMNEYRQILQTQQCGVFFVKRIVKDIGVEIYSPQLMEKEENGIVFVEEEEIDHLNVNEIMYGRVAMVNSKYIFVSANTYPLKILNNKEPMDVLGPTSVKTLAYILFRDDDIMKKKWAQADEVNKAAQEKARAEFEKFEQEILKELDEKKVKFQEKREEPEVAFRKAKENFELVRREIGVKHLFTLDTFNTWIEKPGLQNADFALRTLVFLVPENFLEEQEKHEIYIEAGQNYINCYLMLKQLNKTIATLDKVENLSDAKKAVNDIKSEIEAEQERLQKMKDKGQNGMELPPGLIMKAYSWQDYQELQFSATKLMKEGKHVESKNSYEKLAEKLLNDEVLFWPTFRVFANAATAHFFLGEYFMALGLVSAALRLNPSYGFGKDLKKNLLESMGVKKPNKEIIANFYDKSVFAKYEKFIWEHNVNLNQKVSAKVAKYEIK